MHKNVKAKTTVGSDENDHYVLVEVTTLDADNLAQLPQSIDGFRV